MLHVYLYNEKDLSNAKLPAQNDWNDVTTVIRSSHDIANAAGATSLLTLTD